MRSKSEYTRVVPNAPGLELSSRLQLVELADLREIILLEPESLDISAAAEKKISLVDELKEVQRSAPTDSPVWLAEYVEQKFDVRTKRTGLRLARPESNCLPWDRMVIGKQNMYRVQVKHTTVAQHNVYQLFLKKSLNRPYKRGDFDFLAVLTPAPEYEPDETEAWYIMPFEAIGKRKWISFPRRRSPHYPCAAAKYRDRWDLFE